MLGAAVDDRAHALRHRLVLQRDRRDASERPRPLRLTVDHVVVRAIGRRPPARERVAGRLHELRDVHPVPLLAGLQRLQGIEADRPHHRVVVVERHPDMAGHALEPAGREVRVEGKQVLRDAPVVVLGVLLPLGAVHHAVRHVDEMESRVAVVVVHAVVVLRAAILGGVKASMEEVEVGGVDIPFQPLHPVAFAQHRGDVPMLGRHQRPLQLR